MKGYWVCIYEKKDDDRKLKSYAIKARASSRKIQW